MGAVRTPSDAQVLAWLRQRLAARRSEVEALVALIRSMEEIEESAPGTAPRQQTRTRTTSAKTTADYVMEILSASDVPLSKRDLLDRALAAGWQTNATDPSETIRYAINVLVKEGKVVTTGSFTYAPAGSDAAKVAPGGYAAAGPHADAGDAPRETVEF